MGSVKSGGQRGQLQQGKHAAHPAVFRGEEMAGVGCAPTMVNQQLAQQAACGMVLQQAQWVQQTAQPWSQSFAHLARLRRCLEGGGRCRC